MSWKRGLAPHADRAFVLFHRRRLQKKNQTPINKNSNTPKHLQIYAAELQVGQE